MSAPANDHDFPTTLSGSDVLMWAREETIEQAAQEQLRRVAKLEWTHGVRVMPDVHHGLGATIGSVIAMRQAVAPAAVGVDIGCGMIGTPTSITASDLPDSLSGMRSAIEAAVPVGFAMHDEPVNVAARSDDAGWRDFWGCFGELDRTVHRGQRKAERQIGTLGGGNHFIEVTLDDTDRVWLMLHSGSRGIGNQLARVHIDRAKRLPHNADLPDRDLSVFLAGSAEMDEYMRDLRWAQEYAWRNRMVMMALVRNAVSASMPGKQVTFGDDVQCHHNYVAQEIHDGVEVIVTRKGAISARHDQLGLIPGSMGTGSYVVRGLGNPTSYHSASHGAGRRMSRRQAKKRFTASDLAQQTAGVECRKDAGVVDEIPAAYKDLEQVMAAQSDLVSVVARLRTILCVKG